MKFSEDIFIYFKAFFYPLKGFTIIISGVFPHREAWERKRIWQNTEKLIRHSVGYCTSFIDISKSCIKMQSYFCFVFMIKFLKCQWHFIVCMLIYFPINLRKLPVLFSYTMVENILKNTESLH